MSEVAGQNYYSVKGLKELGVNAKSAVWRKNSFGYPIEYSINIGYKKICYPWYAIKIIIFFIKAVFSFDCFHFHYGNSLLPYNMDLWLLKLLKKKIFFEFHGSELRGKLAKIQYQYYDPGETTSKFKQRALLRIAKYADGFILHDKELLPHLPNCNVPVYIVPLRVDINQFLSSSLYTENAKPLIVHAPSRRSTKGTIYLLNSLELVKAPYELVLVEGVTQEKAFELYKKADLVFDQISVGTYGVFAIEAMALGKPVMTYISDEMLNAFPKTLPIVNVNPDNLHEKIENLLNDAKLRYDIGTRSREYAKQQHDYLKNAKLLKDIYEGNKNYV